MGDDLLQHSKCVKAAKKLLENYRSFEDRVEELYEDSLLYGRIQIFRKAYKEYLKRSFLRKITDAKNEDLDIISSSVTVGALTAFVTITKANMINYFKHSEISSFAQHVRTGLRINMLKSVGLIGLTALMTNTAIVMATKIEMSPFGWMGRLAFILLGMAMIFSNADFKDVKDTHIFVKLFKRGKKR